VSRYAIVFFSNQLTPKRHANSAKTVEAYQTEWKKKIGLIARAVRIQTRPLHTTDLRIDLWPACLQLHDVPFRIFAATKRDMYRKPMPGMWYEIESMFKSSGVDIGSSASSSCRPVRISPTLHPAVTPPSPRRHQPLAIPTDKPTSFYVGDSAGRKGDFSTAASDRKFALNVGVDFHTPEVGSPSHLPLDLPVLIQMDCCRNTSLVNRPQSTASQAFIHLPFRLGVRTPLAPRSISL
jgi:histidinol phosphatase-like enzyme